MSARGAVALALGALLAAAPVRAAGGPCVNCADSLAAGAGHARVALTGRLSGADAPLAIEGCAGRTLLEGVLPAPLDTLGGRAVYANVECLGPDVARVLGGHALGDSVVDLFVMGLCPYARAVEGAIARTLAVHDAVARPPLRLHYLFYAVVDSAGARHVRSLHGPAERRENVVQLALQELEPERFWAYLGDRSTSDADWLVIARRAGIGWRTLSEIQRRLDRELDARVEAEWARVDADWPHVDGSPTAFWLGREVRSLRLVPGFTHLEVPEARCEH